MIYIYIYITITFYVSKKETLLKNAIQFAGEQTGINKNNFEVRFHARQFLQFHSNRPWVKKVSNTFDEAMGAYDGAEPVRIFMI